MDKSELLNGKTLQTDMVHKTWFTLIARDENESKISELTWFLLSLINKNFDDKNLTTWLKGDCHRWRLI